MLVFPILSALLMSAPTAIHSVLVGSHDADFSITDPISNITIGSQPDDAKNSHFHPELKRKLFSAFQEGDDGELAIAIPKEVSLKHAPNPYAMGVFGDGTLPMAL